MPAVPNLHATRTVTRCDLCETCVVGGPVLVPVLVRISLAQSTASAKEALAASVRGRRPGAAAAALQAVTRPLDAAGPDRGE